MQQLPFGLHWPISSSMRRGLFLLACLLPLPTLGEIYKWQDADGRWHYSDTPHSGAVQLDLPPVQTYEPPPLQQQVQALPRPQPQDQEPVLRYARATIVSPAPDATIRSATGELGVVLLLEPSLRRGHRVRLLLDGQPAAEPVAATAFTLVNVDRGEHQLTAEVLDADGRVITRAGPQIFYMHRPSRLH
jgi:hypothetical protein